MIKNKEKYAKEYLMIADLMEYHLEKYNKLERENLGLKQIIKNSRIA